MPRKRGERNWEEVTGEFELHIPPTVKPSDDLEHIAHNEQSELIWVYGTPYLKAADGKLDPLD